MQCGLPLKHTWSVSDLWGQGPFIILWLTLHFMLAFWADLCRSGVKVNLCGFWLLQPSPPPPAFLGLCVGKYGFRWTFYTEFLQCDSASWWLNAEVVPICRVAMDTSGRPWENEGGAGGVCKKIFFSPLPGSATGYLLAMMLWMGSSGSRPTFKEPVPKLVTIGDEFNW